jgi:DNA-directed RNA polymerase
MEGFDQLEEQFRPMIYKMIHSLHIYKNIDEFFQIGLIGLWEAAQSFHLSRGNFTCYAYKFIKGRLLSELKKANKRDERYVFPKEEYWETIGDSMEEQPCEIDMLLSYCGEMTDKQKMWVVYTFMEDLSINEIACKENVSISAVKQWRKGAQEKLKRLQLT